MPDAHATTQDRVGYGGTAHCGSTAGASDVYNSASIQEWGMDMSVDTEDMTGLNDVHKVHQWTTIGATGTIKKMVAAAFTFVEQILADPVVYLTLRAGTGPGAEVGSGDIVREGWAILTGVSVNNAKGKVLEDVKFTFTGAPGSGS